MGIEQQEVIVCDRYGSVRGTRRMTLKVEVEGEPDECVTYRCDLSRRARKGLYAAIERSITPPASRGKPAESTPSLPDDVPDPTEPNQTPPAAPPVAEVSDIDVLL